MFHHVVARKICPLINLKENASIKESMPKSREAWIVCAADMLVAFGEFGKYIVNYNVCLFLLFVINLLTVNR